MRKIIARRLLTAIPTVILCTILVFAFRYMLPGGPVQDMIGGSGGNVSQGQVAALNRRFGLDKSVVVQYFEWVKGIFHGQLGTSYYSSEPVTTVLRQRIPPSLELILGALIVSVVVGLGIGILSAVYSERAGGRGLIFLSGLGLSVPDFWLATIAAGVLGLQLRLLPAVGFTPLSDGIGANLQTVILPVLVLSIVPTAFLARHLNSSMTAALKSSYIRTAWAMGIPARQIYLRCALRNALGPVITFIPLAVASLVGGTVLVENVFNIPGLGTEIVSSVSNQDYPVIQGIVLLVGVLVAMLNLIADASLAAIDPRFRRSAG